MWRAFLGPLWEGIFFQDVLILNNVGKGTGNITIAHVYPAPSVCQQTLYKNQVLQLTSYTPSLTLLQANYMYFHFKLRTGLRLYMWLLSGFLRMSQDLV